MNKPVVLTVFALVIIFGGIFGYDALKAHFIAKFFETFAPPAPSVTVIRAGNVTWQPYLETLGNMTAKNGVDISPEVSGNVKAIFFKSGQTVKKGAALIQLDDSTERAQQEDIKAQLQLAQATLARTKKLFSVRATTQVALDDALTKEKQLKANLESVVYNISKKLIKAPFDGKIGISQINLGQNIREGQVCASLQAINALYAKFSLPQKDIQSVNLKQIVNVNSDAYPNVFFDGYISAIDSKVDENTRTLEVQAVIDNSAGKLYPGMFVDLKVFLPTIPNTVVIPQTAITYTLYGDSAFIVSLSGKKNDKGEDLGSVKRVLIKTGDKIENLVAITEGIKAGDIVVTSGQSKLENDLKIVINNSNTF